MSTKNRVPIFIVCGKSPLTGLGGGYSTIARNIGKNLLSLGQNVYVVALGDKYEQKKTDFGVLVTVPIPLLRIDISALPGLPLYSFLFAKTIRTIARNMHYPQVTVWGIGPWGLAGTILRHLFNVPITHVTSYFTTAKHEWQGGLKALRPADYGWFLRIKFLLIYHTVVRMISFFDRVVLKTSDVIATNYYSTEKILQEEFGISPTRFYRTTFPIETYSRYTDKEENKELRLPFQYILYLSRHDPRKGINFLLHAVKILAQKENPLPLVVAGTGELFEANKKLANKLGLSDLVTFLGFVNNPLLLMKNATIFCFPTLEEGAGALIINEAMSMGIPIVTTFCDGITEDLENNKSALLVPMGDAQALANALHRLSHSPTLQKSLGNEAKRRYQTLFSANVIKEDFQKFLLHLNGVTVQKRN